MGAVPSRAISVSAYVFFDMNLSFTWKPNGSAGYEQSSLPPLTWDNGRAFRAMNPKINDLQYRHRGMRKPGIGRNTCNPCQLRPSSPAQHNTRGSAAAPKAD